MDIVMAELTSAPLASASHAPAARARLSGAVILDGLEKAVLTALFARLLLLNASYLLRADHWFNLLLLVSEGLAMGLALVRRPSEEVSRRRSEWVLAFAATVGPLLVAPAGGRPLVPAVVGAMLLTGGVAVQIAAKATLGRSFGIVPANRGVKVEGPYRWVRHPIYLGYVAVQAGFLLMAPNALNLIIYLGSWSVQVFRLLAEERLLSQDPAYAAFMTRTRWRLLPGLF